MTQCVYDTRVFYKHCANGGFIIAHVHVDDTRITAKFMADLEAFYTLWASDLHEERKPLDPLHLDETFAGIRHHFSHDRHSCTLTCTGTIDQLIPILTAHPLESKYSSDSPIALDALQRLYAPPCPTSNPLALANLHDARRIVGLTSFISSIRSEVIFAFKALSRCVNERRITSNAWREIRRLALYLVNTRTLGLTLTRTNGALIAHVDSSLNNGPDGRSYGGFALQYRGPHVTSGSFMVSCSLPTNACDSSGAAELYQSVRCAKAVRGIRIFLTELGFPNDSPTALFTDARVLIDGTRCKRVSSESKWVSPRYAMIRYAEQTRSIHINKVHTDENLADITTKPLTGAPFLRHRAAILGLITDAAHT
jgi:hypothetical protein